MITIKLQIKLIMKKLTNILLQSFRLLAGALLLLSGQALSAQIAVQDGSATTVNWNNSAGTTLTIPVTVTTGADVLVLAVEDRNANTGSEPATIAWNGATLTEGIEEAHSATTHRGSAIYYLFNPPTANALNLTVTVPGASDVWATCYTLSGVNFGVPPIAGGANSVAASPQTLTFTDSGVVAGSWAAVNTTWANIANTPYTTTITAVNGSSTLTATLGVSAGNSTAAQAGYIAGLPAGSDIFTATWTVAGQKCNFGSLVFTPTPITITASSAAPNPPVATASETISVTATSSAGTISSVIVDASAIGLSPTLALTQGAGNVWSATVTPLQNGPARKLPFIVTDSAGFNLPGSIALLQPLAISAATANPSRGLIGIPVTFSVTTASTSGAISSVTVNASAIGGPSSFALIEVNSTSTYTNTLTPTLAANALLPVTVVDSANDIVSTNISDAVSDPTADFGIHFLGTATTDPVTGTAGVVPIGSWNNVPPAASTLKETITGSDGASTATLIFSGAQANNAYNSGLTGDGANLSLMHGILDAGNGGGTSAMITVSNLSSGCYNVYIYTYSDGAKPGAAGNNLPNYGVNGTTYYTGVLGNGTSTYDIEATALPGVGFAGGFSEGTIFTANTGVAIHAAAFGNYIEIANVPAIGGVITVIPEADTTTFRSPCNGIELVPTALNFTAASVSPNPPVAGTETISVTATSAGTVTSVIVNASAIGLSSTLALTQQGTSSVWSATVTAVQNGPATSLPFTVTDSTGSSVPGIIALVQPLVISAATASPSVAAVGLPVTFSVTTTTTAGTISSVTVNASAIGGPSSFLLIESNLTSTYTNTLTSTIPAGKPLPVVVVDSANDIVSNNISVTVMAIANGITLTWNGGGGANNMFDDGANWVGGTAPGLFGYALVFAGSQNTTVDMENNYTVAGLTFSSTAGSFVITNASDTLTMITNYALVNNSANTETLGVPIMLNGAVTLSNAFAAGSLALTNAISELIAGAGVVTNAGPGTNILAGVNTFTGKIYIKSGGLEIGGVGQLNSGAYAGAISNNGVFLYASANKQTLTGLISGSGGLTVNTTNPAAILTLTTTIPSYTGPTIVNNGELDLNLNNQGSSGLYTSSGLTIYNGGVVKLLSDNCLCGYGSPVGTLPVTIHVGGILGGGQSSHIRGLLTLDGGTLADTAANPNYGSWDLEDGVATAGGPVTSTISAPSVVPDTTGGTIFNILPGATNGIDLNITGYLENGNNQNDTGIIKQGTGVMQMSGTNSYYGTTTISAGTLILADPGLLGGGGGSYANAIINNGAFIVTTTLPQTFSGTISGTGSLTVSSNAASTSAGSLYLSGVDTYSGNTLITNGGTLFLTGSGSINNSPVINVAASSTIDLTQLTAANLVLAPNQALYGIGTINATTGGALTTSSGSVISPSQEGLTSIGTLTIANGGLNMTGGGSVNLALSSTHNGANDQVAIAGTLTGNATPIHLAAPGVVLDQNAPYVLMAAGAISGTFATFPTWDGVPPANAGSFVIAISGNNLVLNYSTIIPPRGGGQAANAVANQNVLLTLTATNGSAPVTSVVVNEAPYGGTAVSFGLNTPSTVPTAPGGVSTWTNSIAIPANVTPGLVQLSATITDSAHLSSQISFNFNIVAATETWNGNGNANVNWDASANWVGGVAPGYNGDSLVFAGTKSLYPSIDQAYTIQALTFSNTAGLFVITNASAGSLALEPNAGVTNNSINNETLGMAIVLNGTATLAANFLAGNLELTNTVSELVAGAGAIVSAGAGTNVLQGINTYTGGTTVNSGTLEIGVAGQLNSGAYAGIITVRNNAVFLYAGANNQTLSGSITGQGGLAVNTTNGAILTLNTTIPSYTGPTIVNGGELDLSFPNINASGIYTSSGLTINNGGIVNVTGQNGLDGYSQPIGTLPITINAGGTLEGGFASYVMGKVTLNGGNLAGTVNGVNSWALFNGVATTGGPVTSIISAPGVVPAQAGGTIFSITNGGTNGIDLNVTGALANNGGNGNNAPDVDTGIIKNGNGVMELSGVNNYNGGTIINAGTLILADPGLLGTGTYTNAITNNSAFIVTTTAGQILSGPISGTGTLTVSSNAGSSAAGALTLSAANTYTGNTIIASGGTLLLAAGGSIGNSAVVDVQSAGTFDVSALGGVTIPLGQTLGGSGTVKGNVTVNGTLSAGETSSIGTLTLNNNSLTLNSGGNVSLRINKTGSVLTSDNVAGISAAAYGGTLTVTETGTGTLAVNDSFTLFGATTASGNFSSIVGPPGYGFTFTPSTGVLKVTSLPPTVGTPIGYSINGKTLTLTWPSAYLGSTLQSNSISVANPGAWFNVPGSANVTTVNITIGSGDVFYRLITP
jgi:autotransporter-associated beta strand protein